MEVENDVLTHYGILGMHWGIRRTPEQLGHKKAEQAKGKLQKYKDKKMHQIDKMYAKSISKTREALEYDPDNKNLKKQLKDLEDLKKQDKSKIESMSYTDVVNAQKAESQARKEKVAKTAATVAKTAGATTLWAARMGLVGVKIYGTVKAAQIVGEMAAQGIEWLQSPEGQALIQKGINTVNGFVSAGDKVATLINPDLSQYVDAEKVASTAINAVKSEVNANLGAEIRALNSTLDSANNAANAANKALEELEKRRV